MLVVCKKNNKSLQCNTYYFPKEKKKNKEKMTISTIISIAVICPYHCSGGGRVGHG